MDHRKDEEPKTWFRSARVFRVDSEWFIHTREDIAVGPYPDKFSADVDAEVLKTLLIGSEASEALTIIQQFMASGGRDLGGGVDSIHPAIHTDTHTKLKYDASEVASLLDDGFDTAHAV